MTMQPNNRQYFRNFTFIILFILTWIVSLSALASVPILNKHITDQTNTLSAEQIEQINRKLIELEKRKGAQFVVLIVPTTKPQDIESYSLAVAEANNIGREGVDDGLLLLVAKDDHRDRIEVGYGLEHIITDANASRILRLYIEPQFKQEDFYNGIQFGVDELIKLIDGENLPRPESNYHSDLAGKLLMLAIGFIPLFIILKGIMSFLSPKSVKICIAVSSATITVLIFLMGGLLTALLGGVFTFLFLKPGSPSRSHHIHRDRFDDNNYGGNEYSDGDSNSGFNGGGGDFGGGGSSGKW